jgi:hypothetical protein
MVLRQNLLGEMARDDAIVHTAGLRSALEAKRLSRQAPRRERAILGASYDHRRRARNRLQSHSATRATRYSGHQRARVGVRGRSQHMIAGAGFNHEARIHHGYAVRVATHHTQIMRKNR